MINITIIILGDIMFDTVIRTLFFYFFVTFCYRIMGKREVGQLGIIDLIVSILIAELVAMSIEKLDQSILYTVLPVSVLVILELVLGFVSVKSRTFNRLFGGKPSIIIKDGKLVYKNLISQRYSLDDLLLELRKKSITSIEDVEYAFLEPNGVLSIFPYKPLKMKSPLPLPIIVEGVIQKDNLAFIDKNQEWLDRVLEKNNLLVKDIFYCIYRKSHLYVIKKK